MAHHRRHRRQRRRRWLPKNYIVDQIAATIVAGIYFVLGFLGTILVPIRGLAGIGFIGLLILSAVFPEAAVYYLLWAFGVGLLASVAGPRVFDRLTRDGRGRLAEIRRASRVRIKEDIPTITLPDPESVASCNTAKRTR